MNEEMRRELDYIFGFVNEGGFDQDIACDQLICLWTAFCLHHGLIVDTHNYDLHLLKLWQEIQKTGDGTSEWADLDGFENFMCAYLV